MILDDTDEFDTIYIYIAYVYVYMHIGPDMYEVWRKTLNHGRYDGVAIDIFAYLPPISSNIHVNLFFLFMSYNVNFKLFKSLTVS